jgi:hypothetical protein
LDSDPDLDNADTRAILVLGESLSAEMFDIQSQPEQSMDDDELTIVLRPRDRIRHRGWLRAPQFALVSLLLLVLGVGVLRRTHRRQDGNGHVHAGITRHHVTNPGAVAAQKVGVAYDPARPRTFASERGRRSLRSRRHPQLARRDRLIWSAHADDRHLPLPTLQEPRYGNAGSDDVPHVNDASPSRAEAKRSVPSGSTPCVPGTLGC